MQFRTVNALGMTAQRDLNDPQFQNKRIFNSDVVSPVERIGTQRALTHWVFSSAIAGNIFEFNDHPERARIAGCQAVICAQSDQHAVITICVARPRQLLQGAEHTSIHLPEPQTDTGTNSS